MVDEADVANDELERQLEKTLKSVDTKIPTNDTNKCIWCGEPIQESDNRRWCSIECRNDHELYANKV
jgi:RNA polymerase-binding transcription factor DksA